MKYWFNLSIFAQSTQPKPCQWWRVGCCQWSAQHKDIYKEEWNISSWAEQRWYTLSVHFPVAYLMLPFLTFSKFLDFQEQRDVITDILFYSPLVHRKASTVDLQGLHVHLPFLINLWGKLCHSHNRAKGKVLSKKNKLVVLTTTSRSPGKGSFNNFLKNFM